MGLKKEIEGYKARRIEIREAEKQRVFSELSVVLEQLQTHEILNQIREELWELGEVVTSTEASYLREYPHYTARVALVARWDRYRAAWSQQGIWGREHETYYHKATVEAVEKKLEVKAGLIVRNGKEEFINISVSGQLGFSIPRKGFNPKEAANRLKERLMEDCIRREEELPYTRQQLADRRRIIIAIEAGNLSAEYQPSEV